MEDNTLNIVIISALLNLFAIVVQRIIDKIKSKQDVAISKSELFKSDSETISNLLESIEKANKNYDNLSNRCTSYEKLIEELGNLTAEKNEEVRVLTERLNCLIDVDNNKNERIVILEKTVLELQEKNKILEKELEEKNSEFTRRINELVEENKIITRNFNTEKEITERLRARVNTLTKKMTAAGLNPND